MDKNFKAAIVSAGAGLKRSFFLLGKDVDEEIKYAYIPELISVFSTDYEKINLRLELGLNLPSFGDLTTKISPFAGVFAWKPFYKDWQLGTGIHLEKRAVETSDQTFSRFEISARKSF
ncbi:MAG TPA: hypothetical protein VNJ08_01120 [Bacteriovoracaceae bacterium]|nr:hypothetical protein [Bacteriovoracaceae bacterium]